MTQRLTRDEFERIFLGRVFLEPPFDVVPCSCGDVNCHGWRFVPRRIVAAPESTNRAGELHYVHDLEPA